MTITRCLHVQGQGRDAFAWTASVAAFLAWRHF